MAKLNKKPKKGKVYDLTANSTGAFVKKYIERLRKTYRTMLKNTEIPAMVEISRSPDPLGQYFLDRRFHMAVLGANNIRILDRLMREAIATNIAKDVRHTMDVTGTYPGLWSELDLSVLALTMVNIEVICDDEGADDLYMVLSMTNNGRISESEHAERDVSTWMRFDDYNPNRLYQHCAVVQDQIIRTVVNEIRNSVPAANLAVASESVETRYGRGLVEVLSDDIERWRKIPDRETKDMDHQAQDFISCVEGPIMNYVSLLLGDSGISGAILRRAFEASKAKASYKTDIRGGKSADTFVHPWTKMNYQLYYSSEDGVSISSGASFIVSPNDLVTICRSDEDINQNAKRYAIDRVGSALRSFMTDMVRYAINIYLFERNNAVVKENDSSESADGADMPADAQDDTVFE